MTAAERALGKAQSIEEETFGPLPDKWGSVLLEAQYLVHGQRGADYGHPFDDYLCTANMWRALILRRYGVDVPLTPDFACLMMAVMKASREAGKPKRDNRVDGAGYLECVDMCLEERKRRGA